LRFIAANAFEDRGGVADDVGEDVECGVVPVDEFSVVPDFFGLGDGHVCSSVRCNFRIRERGGGVNRGKVLGEARKRQIGAVRAAVGRPFWSEAGCPWGAKRIRAAELWAGDRILRVDRGSDKRLGPASGFVRSCFPKRQGERREERWRGPRAWHCAGFW